MKILSILLIIIVSCAFAYQSEEKDWYEKTIFYQIYPRSFMDSNGDGIGDLKGITSRLEHLKECGVTATWLSPIFKSPMVDFGYDISDYKAIQPEYGTMEDFTELMQKAKDLGIKIILDFVPNHTSDQCEWFQRSVERDPEYDTFYIWNDGKPNPSGGDPLPPNNWVSVFHGSAWTYHPERKQFYFHQFTKEQPDLNYRNPRVVAKMKGIIQYWLSMGVAGFRIDAVNHLYEVEDLRDEPVSPYDNDPLSYGHLEHYYTKDLPEVYDMIYQWREVLDEWKTEYGGDTRIMMTEAYANITFTMKYYESEDGKRQGSHIPFNFLLISDLNKDSVAYDFVNTINKWMTYMPAGKTANWVLGNHDNPRVASRYGVEHIDALNTLLLTLPGAGITYNGEEIGMIDYRNISWADTVDPAACNTNPQVYMNFSRDPERTPFQWDNTKNAGFSTADKTWLPVNPNYVNLNLKAQKEADSSHYKFYQQLSDIRKRDTFIYGDFKIKALNKNVFAYVRELRGNDTFVVLINLGPNDETVNLKTFATLKNRLIVVLSSSQSDYHPGDVIDVSNLTFGPHEVLIFLDNTHSGAFASRLTSSLILVLSVLICYLVLVFDIKM